MGGQWGIREPPPRDPLPLVLLSGSPTPNRSTASGVGDLISRFVAWARTRDDVAAAALVGSHARGEAGPDSDVDLMLVTRAPDAYVTNPEWVHELGRVQSVVVEERGAVTSLRVRYEEGPEVEFGLTSPEWARTDPVDPGTARVVSGGLRILVDRDGLLRGLLRPTL